MKRAMQLSVWALAAICYLRGADSAAQLPEMPKPSKEHVLLKQFAGEWDMTAESEPAPGQEAIKCKGTESATMVGGFWLVNQSETTMMGMPVKNVMTLGYDPKAK